MNDREQGRIKFYNQEREFGFVRTDSGDDLFVHVSSLGFLEPEVGARVSFERGVNPRTNRPEAKSVAILDDGEAKMENAT
ncbi:MAG: cold shock domain-containing protein [Xanthobacteraceae bacterium]|jgi:CspA family cold shock protein